MQLASISAPYEAGSNSKATTLVAPTSNNIIQESQLWFISPSVIRIGVQPTPRFITRGSDSSHWQNKSRDCSTARHLPPASLRYFAGAQTGSPAVAVRPGKLFGDGAGVWVRMQAAYDSWTAERKEDVSKIPTLLARAA
jgi:hypothetical protein